MSQSKSPATTSKSAIDQAAGITRRNFLRCAGAGAAALMAASGPTTTLADDTNTQADASNSRIVGWLSWDDNGTTTTPFVFDPQFFSTSALKYNAQLSTFGCCVALAAFNAKPGGGGTYKDMYVNELGLLKQIGCKIGTGDPERHQASVNGVKVDMLTLGDYSWNYDYNIEPTYDYSKSPKSTIGLSAGHRTINVGGKDYNLVILGVRGGNYEIEWASNVTVGKSGNHEGFQEAADHAVAFLKHYIESHDLMGPTKILICGFSRGGATTNLAGGTIVKHAVDIDAAHDDERGYDLSRYIGNSKIDIWQSDLYVYGYEVPAGAMPANDAERRDFKEKYANIHSVINPCDIVAKVAPAKWGFMRYGTDKVLPGPSDRSRYLSGREKMKERLYALANHRKDGSRFSYDLDSFPAIDYSMLTEKGALVKQMLDMKALDLYVAEFVDLIATDVFHARNGVKTQIGIIENYQTGYYDDYQSTLITAMELYVRLPAVEILNKKDADGKSPLTKFTELAGRKILDKIVMVFGEFNAHVSMVTVVNCVEEALREVKLSDGKTFSQNEYGQKIKSVVNKLFAPDYRVGPSFYSSLSTFVSQHTQEVIAMAQKGGVIMSAHNNDLCLAWLQSRDSNYYKYGKEDLPGAPELTSQAQEGGEAVALLDEGAALAVASADGDDEYGGADDDWGETYRKVVFNGGTSVSYLVNGTSYTIFENGEPVYADDEGSEIMIEGEQCPFIYGLDGDLQQVVYLSDAPNQIDDKTSYTFALASDPDAPVIWTAARYTGTDPCPKSLFVYESPVGCFVEPLTSYEFVVGIDMLSGSASTSANNGDGEMFECDFETAGVTWRSNQEDKAEKDLDDNAAERYHYIDTRTANAQMGGINGGGTSTRGTKSLIVAVPNEGYEFDYWTLDDKYMVDGKETSPYTWIGANEGEAMNAEATDAVVGEWVEGQRVGDEVYEGFHVYRALVDDDHLVTAHFKAKSVAPDDGKGDDVDGGATVVDGGSSEGEGASSGAGTKKGGKTPETGDSSLDLGVAAAGFLALAGAAMAKNCD